MTRVFPSIFGAFMPNSVTLVRFDRALLEQVQGRTHGRGTNVR
jgi:hypothetical protein